MPNTDLTRARRLLAELRRRQGCANVASVYCIDHKHRRVARRMSRELSAQIAAQELEVRRLALQGPWKVEADYLGLDVYLWGAVSGTRSDQKWYGGRNAKARAVAYAEKMNAKARKDGAS